MKINDVVDVNNPKYITGMYDHDPVGYYLEEDLPWFDSFPLLAEIYVGACLYERIPGAAKVHPDDTFTAAHCHVHPDPEDGSICFPTIDLVGTDKPHPVFLHEYAHLLSTDKHSNGDSIHGDHFESTLRELLDLWGYEDRRVLDTFIDPTPFEWTYCSGCNKKVEGKEIYYSAVYDHKYRNIVTTASHRACLQKSDKTIYKFLDR